MMNLVALCALGAERALSNELKKLNLRVHESNHGKVRFSADLPGLYHALMGLRTADRVLLEVARFSAVDFDQLFEGVKSVPWESYLHRGASVVVEKVRSSRSRLSAVTSIQSVAHKALAERLCGAWQVDRLNEDEQSAEVRLYVDKDQVDLLLDLSGEPLFKRGYRTEGGAAPLRETTAASILLLSGWKRKFPLYDPFCGSGTIALEAALYAWNAAPGLGRSFALSRLAIADSHIEQQVRQELRSQVDFNRTIRIYGSDTDGRAVSIAQSNARRAYEIATGAPPLRGIRADRPEEYSGAGGVSIPLPRFRVQRMEEARPSDPEGFIITNPPYGQRLGNLEDAEKTYQAMGRLAEHFSGWKLVVITDHPGFESHFGYAADSMREITNGAIRSYLYTYERLGSKADVHRRGT
jgi:putative N6-adenine-specific DNA methylase